MYASARSALRFPGACIAVLLYIVVAVVAAPNNHVGTRIYMCGFMIGPMWLAMATGGVVVGGIIITHQQVPVAACTLMSMVECLRL